jgi:Ca2+-binding RTX toxin-like protein
MAIFYGTTGIDYRYGTLNGSFTRDIFYLYEGNDWARGHDGNDEMHGDGGNDQLFGDDGADALFGGNGNDWLDGGADRDGIYGGAGDDTILGGYGGYGPTTATQYPTYLYGEAGNDIIYTDQSVITNAYGGDDNDIVYHTSSLSLADYLDGGAGWDTISYEFATEGMRIDLLNGRATEMDRSISDPLRDTVVSFENVVGSNFDDVIFGGIDTYTNEFWDGGGNDVVFGYNGTNIFHDQEGNDTFYGGSGIDYYVAGSGNNRFFGGAGEFDSVSFGESLTSSTYIHYFQASDLVRKFQGNSYEYDYIYDIEKIDGTSQSDNFNLTGSKPLTIYGHEGQDTINYVSAISAVVVDLLKGTDNFGNVIFDLQVENISGSNFYDKIYGSNVANNLFAMGGIDTIYGRGGDDRLTTSQFVSSQLYGFGGDGNDYMEGGLLNDRLYGQAGTDTLLGRSGNDILSGGTGRDSLTGGGGVDQFYFAAVTESGVGSTLRDTISDFTVGQDKINVRAIDAITSTTINDAFVLDTNGVFTAGEIRQQDLGSSLLLSFYVNNDAIVDMQIIVNSLNNPAGVGNFTLSEASFYL